MALYRVTADKLETVKSTSFIEERLLERDDLQRLLKADISAVAEDLLVIAEEYGDWEESNRRIDLLCLRKDAQLVVIEIKRTEDGGHMELQALRYAAMVSSMTMEQAIDAYARTLGTPDAHVEARKEILEFLELDSIEEAELTGEVSIVLASADFSTELTTTVLWLNRQGLDITCVRLAPYRLGGEVLIDVTQIIPLKEAADYEIKIRAQAQEKRKVQSARHELFRRFWAHYIERSKATTNLYLNKSTSGDHWISAGIGRTGFALYVAVTENQSCVQCYLEQKGENATERNKSAFNALYAQRDAIEATFGEPLDWQELPNRIGCRICTMLPGGWKTPESEWPQLQDRMLATIKRLEAAFKESVRMLKF
jgi:hypothetical protein